MSTLAPYERFGRYQLLHRIAVGGMAEIFLAFDPEADAEHRVLVIKRIRSDLCSDREFVDMFIDEERAISQLSHPNIIKMREFGVVEGRYFIALEHVWGESLGTLTQLLVLQKKRFPVGAGLYIAAQTALALDHAHRRVDADGLPAPVIHRDVTLGNVIVSYEGQVKVLDFGIAKAKDRLAVTHVGQVKGTLSYLSPEQLKGEPDGPHTDIYQLGVLLYQTLLGRAPVLGNSDAELMAAIIDGSVIPPSALIEDFPPPVERMILKCMALDPRHRFRTAGEIAEAAQRLMGPAFNEGQARLAQVVAKVTGDRKERQQSFIQNMLDGLEGEGEAADLFDWATDSQSRRITVGPSQVMPMRDLDHSEAQQAESTEVMSAAHVEAIDDLAARQPAAVSSARSTPPAPVSTAAPATARGPANPAESFAEVEDTPSFDRNTPVRIERSAFNPILRSAATTPLVETSLLGSTPVRDKKHEITFVVRERQQGQRRPSAEELERTINPFIAGSGDLPARPPTAADVFGDDLDEPGLDLHGGDDAPTVMLSDPPADPARLGLHLPFASPRGASPAARGPGGQQQAGPVARVLRRVAVWRHQTDPSAVLAVAIGAGGVLLLALALLVWALTS